MIPSTTFAYFDLADSIENIQQDFVRMQVAQSYAWTIDRRIVAAVRELFKTVRDNCRTGSLDDAVDYNNALAEQSFAEAQFNEIGSDSRGPVRTVHELLDIRNNAHVLAATCTRTVLDWKGNLRSYTEPDLMDLFTPNGNMKVRADTVAKIERTARYKAHAVAGHDPALEKQIQDKLLTTRIASEKVRLSGMRAALSEQVGALQMMFRIVQAKRPAKMPEQHLFHQLHLDLQRELISSAKTAADRAVTFAESDSNVAVEEIDDIVLAAALFGDHLSKVLAAPKFNSGVQMPPQKEQLLPKTNKPAQSTGKKLPTPKKTKTPKPIKDIIKDKTEDTHTDTAIGQAMEQAAAS